MPEGIAICNTGPLIALAKVNRVDVLTGLFAEGSMDQVKGRTILRRARFVVALGVMLFVGVCQALGEQTNFPAVNVLVGQLIVENGGRTNVLPKFSGEQKSVWRVTKDEYGAQVWLKGNQLPAMREMLKVAYGEPVYVRTNNAGTIHIQYNKTQVGVGLSLANEVTKGGEFHTHLIVLGPKALEELAGKGRDKATEREKSADEARAEEIAIKAATEKGMKGELMAVAMGSTNVGWAVKVFEASKGMFSDEAMTVMINRGWRVVRVGVEGR